MSKMFPKPLLLSAVSGTALFTHFYGVHAAMGLITFIWLAATVGSWAFHAGATDASRSTKLRYQDGS